MKQSQQSNDPLASPPGMISVTVDGRTVLVPRTMQDWQGRQVPTTMLQACELAGVTVPHYCYHPKLPVAGNCRMCLVEYGVPALGPDRKPIRQPDGSLVIKKSPRPAIACATPVSPGMEIYTSTPTVKLMRQSVLEFLLINHPLDCPICDQAGECKLQEYSVEYGRSSSRFADVKVHKNKQIDLGPRIMLDQERCILCSRCIRFTRDVVGDDALGIINRGSYSAIAAYPGTTFDNNYTLNTADICPVGALTSKDFRFQMRVWFLKETMSLCASCGTGCNIVIGSRENRIYRFTPRQNDAVNSCWMCDYGRLNYHWIERTDRLTHPGGTKLNKPDWEDAINGIAEALKRAVPGHIAIVASARLANEELYLVRRLAQYLGAPTDCVARSGPADNLLLCADRNPNTKGAQLLGIAAEPPGANLPLFARLIRNGTIRSLLVFGEDMTRHGITTEDLARLDFLGASDIHSNGTTAVSHYVLPGCAHVEKRGSFTNVHGRIQKFEKAIDPPGLARPELYWLRELVCKVTGHSVGNTVESVCEAMRADVPAFRNISWADLGDLGVTTSV